MSIQNLLALLAFFPQLVFANPITVTDVKVSATATSPAEAREKAITEAHKAAFAKLIEEHYPMSPCLTPPEASLLDMVTNFSIDREKTTSKSYTASLTFQFDDALVRAWVENATSPTQASSSSLSPSPSEGIPLILNAHYETFEDWRGLKKNIEQLCGPLKLISLSRREAKFQIKSPRAPSALPQDFEEKGLVLTPHGNEWRVFLKGSNIGP